MLPPVTNDTKISNKTTLLVVKAEMLDWLRSDLDLDTASNQLASDRVTRSMKELHVEEKKDNY